MLIGGLDQEGGVQIARHRSPDARGESDRPDRRLFPRTGIPNTHLCMPGFIQTLPFSGNPNGKFSHPVNGKWSRKQTDPRAILPWTSECPKSIFGQQSVQDSRAMTDFEGAKSRVSELRGACVYG